MNLMNPIPWLQETTEDHRNTVTCLLLFPFHTLLPVMVHWSETSAINLLAVENKQHS